MKLNDQNNEREGQTHAGGSKEKKKKKSKSAIGTRTMDAIYHFQQIQRRPSTPSCPHQHHPQSIRTGQRKSKRQQLSRIWAWVTGFPGCRAEYRQTQTEAYTHRNTHRNTETDTDRQRRLACRALGYFLFRLFQSRVMRQHRPSSIVSLVKATKRHWDTIVALDEPS